MKIISMNEISDIAKGRNPHCGGSEMKYNPDIHYRHSIRLKGYDYSQPGAYFITICTQNRACMFGEVVGGEMELNDAGKMIEKWYFQLEHKFPDILCDACVIMPNHFHAIIVNVGADLRVCPDIYNKNGLLTRPDVSTVKSDSSLPMCLRNTPENPVCVNLEYICDHPPN